MLRKTLPGIAIAIAFALAGCDGGGRQAGTGAIVVDPCHVGGCSYELCSDQPGMTSVCVFKPGYACYKSAVCEPQQDGACGWTQTPELTSCIARGGP